MYEVHEGTQSLSLILPTKRTKYTMVHKGILVTQPYSLLTSGKQYKQILLRKNWKYNKKTIEKHERPKNLNEDCK
jgi:hypothetical protein